PVGTTRVVRAGSPAAAEDRRARRCVRRGRCRGGRSVEHLSHLPRAQPVFRRAVGGDGVPWRHRLVRPSSTRRAPGGLAALNPQIGAENMNVISTKRTLLVTVAALVLVGAAGAARADDMAGMKMDHEKKDPDKKSMKEPGMDSGGAKAK